MWLAQEPDTPKTWPRVKPYPYRINVAQKRAFTFNLRLYPTKLNKTAYNEYIRDISSNESLVEIKSSINED